MAILAIATPWDIFLSFPALEKASGMITAIPSPIKPKPIIKGKNDSKVNRIIEPIKATKPE